MELSTLITIVIVLAILILVVYVIEAALPTMPPPYRIVLRGVVLIGFLLWLLRFVGQIRL